MFLIPIFPFFASLTIRYGPTFDFLHHKIGSTHVAHHVESSIPHYNALEATEALKTAFPNLYLCAVPKP